jgi:hypothetical protein
MVLRAIPVAWQTALIPPRPAASGLRRRKAATTTFIQHRDQRVVAKLDGGKINHRPCLQSTAEKGNPHKNGFCDSPI